MGIWVTGMAEKRDARFYRLHNQHKIQRFTPPASCSDPLQFVLLVHPHQRKKGVGLVSLMFRMPVDKAQTSSLSPRVSPT